jgi:hypothetical protein
MCRSESSCAGHMCRTDGRQARETGVTREWSAADALRDHCCRSAVTKQLLQQRQAAHLSLQSEMALTGCTPLKPGGSCCGADSRASRAALKVAANSSAFAYSGQARQTHSCGLLQHDSCWGSGESVSVQLRPAHPYALHTKAGTRRAGRLCNVCVGHIA